MLSGATSGSEGGVESTSTLAAGASEVTVVVKLAVIAVAAAFAT